MKKKRFILPLLAVSLLAGCSKDESSAGLDNGGQEGEPQYLTVNLVTASASGASTLKTRAAGNQHPGKPDEETDTYEEGLAGENTVSKIRFYFFDKDGAAVGVKKNGENSWQNYLDWTNISEEGKKDPNVEKILSAMLVINTKKGDKQPDKIVAIINPQETADTYSLGGTAPDLYAVTGDYQKFVSGNFVMSNSTFKNGNAKEMEVSVDGKIFDTPGKALKTPVEIYVERTVAKVRLNSSLSEISEGSGIYSTKTPATETTEEKTQTVTLNDDDGEKEIYVKFLGWNTTAVADKTRLIKEINPGWDIALFGNAPWNWTDYHRSFWAVNAAGLNYQYGAFDDSNKTGDNLFQAREKSKFDKSQWVYVNENASDTYADGNWNDSIRTKVIIAAQLVDETGAALEFAEYGTERCSVDKLKNTFADNCGLYKKTSSNPETYVKITQAELKIVTATEIGMASKTQNGRYKVYIQLNDDAAQDGIWYPSNASGQTEPLTALKANEALKNLGSAKVWKNGYTYYYFDIKHLGDSYGVVRNHIYDANITTLTGLGTPVYKPEEIIYPERPEPDTDTYIAARINILSWRVVSDNVKLDW